jgi:hypothetical protein
MRKSAERVAGGEFIRYLTMQRLMCLTQGKPFNGVYPTGESPKRKIRYDSSEVWLI